MVCTHPIHFLFTAHSGLIRTPAISILLGEPFPDAQTLHETRPSLEYLVLLLLAGLLGRIVLRLPVSL